MVRFVQHYMFLLGFLIGTPSSSVLHAATEPAATRVEFNRDVRPILAKSCFSCHGPEKQRGGLRLDRKTDALRGGDAGKVLIPQKPSESPLFARVLSTDVTEQMPPKGDRLPAAEVAILKAWIEQGANWPDDATASSGSATWWAFRGLNKPAIPGVSDEWKNRARNPIDQFVLARLREKGLQPSAEADRRTLLRRVFFDLTGLPPTLQEAEAFLSDTRPDAYERLVDRLLASPHYGERWARHWLDVVHYGDTHGYDKDQPRPNAWPYRDYVIRAFNTDKPYSRFVQEQIAGDVLFPGTTDGITALGFIAAGPWDFIGHAEVPETKIDGKIARHLDRDDMVANTINTFVSLTVQCAQCHNHKFDPIPQEDYYRLQAVFAAIDRTDRPYHASPATAEEFARLSVEKTQLQAQQKSLEARIVQAGGVELAAIDRELAAAITPHQPRVEYGYHSQIESRQDQAKWVQVDLGKPAAIDRVVLLGCHDTFNNIGAGFGFPVRFKVEVASDAEFKTGVVMVADQTAQDVPNPGTEPVTYPAKGVVGRYLRVTATRLAPRQNDFIFALAELEVLDKTGTNLAAGGVVAALDTIEAAPRWRKSNLTDGIAVGKSQPQNLPALRTKRQKLLDRLVDKTIQTQLKAVTATLARIDGELTRVKPSGMVYAGGIHNGGGAFRGTGPDGGKPRSIAILKRGDVRNPLREVTPGSLTQLPGLPGEFHLQPNHTEGDRRAALARWLTDPANPLPWRSIVNRVWQYHFGRGIVATPNDFGNMGQLPTHPELLDYLAADFRDNGQSLKKLHRLIVTSATYRQASTGNEQAEAIDGGNSYLWRMNRRKLEAEAIRDSVLAVAGKLDATLYGPAFQDFVVEHPEHSPHYEYHLANPDDPKTFRRSIYRFLARSKPQPFFTALDCADPSTQVERRTETLSPLQALALYNDGFMLTMAKYLAARVEKAGSPDQQITAAFQLALIRKPTEAELSALVTYSKAHGLPNACRVILNLNEFVFAD